jgi:hypothetical protein
MSVYIIATVSQENVLDFFTVTSSDYGSITKYLTEINPKSFIIISSEGIRQDDTDKIYTRQKTEFFGEKKLNRKERFYVERN